MNPTPSSRAWLVWGVGVAVYLLAVFNRSSLAVAGLIATDRFHISAGQLSTFAMLQLLVYAGMQIPVGVMVDRFGPRTVLVTGLVVMSAAQAGFAMATSYPEALIARIFVGMGDAMTFICVLRLVSAWFSLRRIPLVTQLTGNVGQLGALLAAVPMTWALSHLGWHAAYLIAAGAGPVLLLPLLIFLRDTPRARNERGTALSLPDLGRNLRDAWAQPGTRLGFWLHFTTPFSATVLALLWGYPFFVEGEHLSDGAAGSLLSLIVVANIVAGPVLGWLVGRYPWHRSSLALVIIGAIVLSWTVVLAWPGHAPYWLLAVTVFLAGCGGPGSMIAFDVGRTSNPGHRLASASGIINVAGFVAALVTIVAVGFILDWRTPAGSSHHTDAAFHWALSFQYVVWGLGTSMILRHRRIIRRRLQRADVDSGDSMVRLAG